METSKLFNQSKKNFTCCCNYCTYCMGNNMGTRRRRARGQTITVIQNVVLPKCTCTRSNAYLQKVFCYYSCKMFKYSPLKNQFGVDDPKYVRELANAIKLREQLNKDIVSEQMRDAYFNFVGLKSLNIYSIDDFGK